MSTSLYRTQVAQHQRTIARLQGDKVKKVNAAANAGKKSADASAAASKTSSASTMKSKLRDALRYDTEQTKALSDVRQLEKKIFEAQKRLSQSEQRLTDALKRDQRRTDAAQDTRS